ncbi:MAG: TetR/AcrR family transcriptional regulator [Sphingomonadaceae bacterium]|nr:TetR/AcrR family transcriptional regulator [Sphingomonadaceae bacterium]
MTTRRKGEKTLRRRKEPTQARGRHSIEQILEATHRVLRRDGPTHITTPAIAEEAGVSVGALYHYFPNKESVILALYETKLAHIRSMVETPIEPVDGDLKAGLRRWIRDIKAREAAIGYDLAMNEAIAHFPSIRGVARRHASGQAQTIANQLKRLGSQWPDEALFDLALHAFYLNSSLWLYWSYVGQPLPQAVDRLAETVAALFVRALDGSPPPPPPYGAPMPQNRP